MTDPLFTVLADGRLQPNGPSRGPWSEHALHGGPVAAAIVRAAEACLRETGAAAVDPVRLTIDLERPVPLAPLRFEASIIRPGRKVQVAQVCVFDGNDRRLVRATVLAIRRLALDLPADLHAPDDRQPPPPTEAVDGPLWDPLPGIEAFHSHGVEHRFVRGAMVRPGPVTDWIRLAVPVVAGEEPSPFQRVVAAADFANGVSAVLAFGEWTFINPDLTVAIHRLPVGEWVAIDAATRVDASGVATAEAELFDERGRIGRAIQTLIVEPAGR